MSTILVEEREHPLIRQILEPISETCRNLGHRVVRWRGPLSGRVSQPRRLQACQAAFIWNGAHPKLQPVIGQLRRMQSSVAVVELGWDPQAGTCQMDLQGINANASWASEPLATRGVTPLPIRSQGDLLVALQLDDDTQVTALSPWFANMRQFVEFLCRHARLPVRVRPHPRAPVDHEMQRMVLELGGSWDDSPNFAAALQRCRAVAILNSSVGFEALGQRLPVLCYGLANYRQEGAVYCLDATPEATSRATTQLMIGISDLKAERVQAAYERVMSHQWASAEIPRHLPALLAKMLAREPAQIPTVGIWSHLRSWFDIRKVA